MAHASSRPSEIFRKFQRHSKDFHGLHVRGYLGFKFDCTPGGPPVCYGYAHLTTAGTTGFPATLVDYCYDNSGAAIAVRGD